MSERVLITGASGLLGLALVEVFLAEGFQVAGQYHSRMPGDRDNCSWLQADFSTPMGIDSFLENNKTLLWDCPYLINNYGPITYKETGKLRGGDFSFDYFHNVVTAVEITRFMLERGGLKSVVNMGFEYAGEIKPYKKILSYAAAKNALLMVTRSYALAFPATRFSMVSPGTLEGAAVKLQKGNPLAPLQVAREIYKSLIPNNPLD